MKTRYNLIIFTIAEEERMDIRKRKEKTLQVLIDTKNYQFPIFSIDEGKSLRDTAYEKAKEILGTKSLYIEQLYTWSDPKYYEEEPQIIITYLVTVNQKLVKNCPKDYQFFRVELKELTKDNKRKIQEVTLTNPSQTIAYRMITKNKEWNGNVLYQNEIEEIEDEKQVNLLTATILHTAMKRMRHRIENTKLAFHFLEEEFTLSELQQVYELLLDRKLEKANFRKKIEPMVQKTERKVAEAAYRPAQAYRYNDQYIIYWV